MTTYLLDQNLVSNFKDCQNSQSRILQMLSLPFQCSQFSLPAKFRQSRASEALGRVPDAGGAHSFGQHWGHGHWEPLAQEVPGTRRDRWTHALKTLPSSPRTIKLGSLQVGSSQSFQNLSQRNLQATPIFSNKPHPSFPPVLPSRGEGTASTEDGKTQAC